MMNRTPKRESNCAHCGDPLDLEAAYWLFLGSDHPTPSCESCAYWHAEGFFAAACILEVQAIIHATHAQLNARAAIAAR